MHNVHDCVRQSRAIHLPFAHVKETADAFKYDPASVLTTIPEKHRSQVDACMRLKEGDIINVPNGKCGLLVRITSPLQSGILDTLCIACKPRDCGHAYLRHGAYCAMCHESVLEVFDSTNTYTYRRYLREGAILEPFYTLFFEVDVLGVANYNGVDGRTIAGISASGASNRFWRLAV